MGADNETEDPCSAPGVCGSAVTGLLQMLLGAGSITAGVFIILEDNDWLPIGIAIWGGCIFLIAGFIGFSVFCCRVHNTDDGDHRCLAFAYMLLSIIAALTAAGQVVWESWASIVHTQGFDLCETIFQDASGLCGDRLSQYMHITAACCAGVELFIAIGATIIVGSGACCNSTESSQPPTINVNIEIPEQQPNPPAIVNLSVPPSMMPHQPPPPQLAPQSYVGMKQAFYPEYPVPILRHNSPKFYSDRKALTLYEIEGPTD